MQIFPKKHILFLFILTLLFLGNISVFSQLTIPPKPNLQTSVYDEAGLLKASEKNALEQKLIRYNDTTSTQIVVAIINTLNGEDIALYATKWAHEWGVGQEKQDNGVFVLVAKNDRKLWIATGYGVEHLLTDALSKRIVNNIITPQFKQGNYYNGLDRGTSAIMQVLNGEFQGTPQNESDGHIPIVFIVFFVIILFIILTNRNKGNGGNRGHRHDGATQSILEAIILSRVGRGGFGGGSFGGGSSGGFGGGGFGGGFGGGGFGGGGAGGSW
ncbi:TPM domain-containing protein [Aureibaculum marinum]|uniref:TPM domain-containing protein n=1 Tax=Aureibaculum marinum TaxID=2487930 RepID=A0A3N4NJU2_9FLAO|nr:TPM domain-containing protein [Aureibaculum marinum]RPD91789.1 TPM domain-containing protein [Aureibaculum marinum]